MSDNNNWPFANNDAQVVGRKLPAYLAWATGGEGFEKELLLPPIQRGFVWKPKQIVDLWDSLLRGMPIGSLMLSKLSAGQIASTIATKDTKKTKMVSGEAMGLLDGQQRTLAMLIGWPFKNSTQHCLWIDLVEKGHAGSPFDIRLTTQAQPFGFERISQGRLSRHARREARKHYDNLPENKLKRDHELFVLGGDDQPRPWKANRKPEQREQFVRVRDLWGAFTDTNKDKQAFLDLFKDHQAEERLSALHQAFTRLELLEVPLILIPEHIGMADTPNDAPNPLVLLFERIGRNGASLSTEDLLFSMIKQQWPEAQGMVNDIHGKVSVRAFMSATDYVMTAYRLGAAGVKGITDNPRPSPNDFHRHLGAIFGKEGDKDKPLRDYLGKDNPLELAFKSLFELLRYKGDQDIGLPLPMMPHLPRGLIQVWLRWIMLNLDSTIIEDEREKIINDNRKKIISFGLFWYVNVLHDDKASKMAFAVIKKGSFPANELYKVLIASPNVDELGLALPLLPSDEIKNILNWKMGASPKTHNEIFDIDKSKLPQRELYKRFCWWRKPILLWLQRAYVVRAFDEQASDDFAGLTDEDTVPYDFDHLCPQNHWGSDWRSIRANEEPPDGFQHGRHISGNCIGNLHVLESSLNRSFGDNTLAQKVEAVIEQGKWCHEDSLLYDSGSESKSLWDVASPIADESVRKTWGAERVEAFQGAVYGRAFWLYCQYYEACKQIMSE